MKSLAKGLAFINLSALVVTAVIVWLLGQSSVPELLDTATYVGFGIGALGALMFVGSTSGSRSSTGMAASAADQPSRIMDALWTDRLSGISMGALFVLSGTSWLGIAWLLAKLIAAYQS